MHRIDVSHFQLYSKDNSKFTYYTSTGKFTIHAGQDGVTEDWIQQIKELHRIERNDIRREQQNSSIDAITSLVGDKSESLTSDSSPEEIYFRYTDRKYLHDRLKYALGTLNERQFTLLISVRLQKRTITSIAREEGVDESSVRERLKRIEKKLRSILMKKDN